MEGENQPILTIVETRINFFLHIFRLAAQLRPHIRNVHRIACLVFTFVGDAIGIGSQVPAREASNPEKSTLKVVANRLDLSLRIESINVRGLFACRRTALRTS